MGGTGGGGGGRETDGGAVGVDVIVGDQRPAVTTVDDVNIVTTYHQQQQQTQKKNKWCHCQLMISRRWSWRAYVACACSFLVSIGGGGILVLWEMNYHRSNSQQWMVPLGLIFFATPVFVGIASCISDSLSSSSAPSSLPTPC